MLELNQISKSYADVYALERCDLSIASGQTTVLIGPSGCGKPAILRLIMGLQTPDEGSIHFAGQRMGYGIQDGGLFPPLCARDNVALMARYLRWPVRDGRIVQQGTMEQLLREPANDFVRRFVQAQRSPLETMEISG